MARPWQKGGRHVRKRVAARPQVGKGPWALGAENGKGITGPGRTDLSEAPMVCEP